MPGLAVVASLALVGVACSEGDSADSTQKLSGVADFTPDGLLKCPKCGGTELTARRSNKGKVVGIGTLGVGGLIAPKSQVKCVTCGTMFKRG